MRTHQNRDIKLCLLSVEFNARSLCSGSWQLFTPRGVVLATVSRGLFATAPGNCPFPVEPLLIKVLTHSVQRTACNCSWQWLLHLWSSYTRVLNYYFKNAMRWKGAPPFWIKMCNLTCRSYFSISSIELECLGRHFGHKCVHNCFKVDQSSNTFYVFSGCSFLDFIQDHRT